MDEPRSRRHPEWVYRKKEIPGAGDLWVPSYIYRIDKETSGKSLGGGGTAHGWQVRYEKPSAFFSDYLTETSTDTGNADPLASLAMAEAYLSSIWRGRKAAACTHEERPTKKIALGMSGLALRIKHRSNGAGTMCHICELRVYSNTGQVLRYLYVGVVNKLTLARLMSVIEVGMAMRLNHLKELGVPIYEEPEFKPEVFLRGTPLEHLIPEENWESETRKLVSMVPSSEDVDEEFYRTAQAASALNDASLGKRRPNPFRRGQGLPSVNLPSLEHEE